MLQDSFHRNVALRIKAAVPAGLKARLRGNGLRPFSAAEWDAQYGAGRWDYLAEMTEAPRHGVITAYYSSLTGCRSALDVGCGAGVLQSWLRRIGCDRYVGIDLSKVAIELARQQADGTTDFAVADAGSFVPPQDFDAIIFNEMLYYLPDPVAVVQRFARYLTANGAFIVSLWECRESRAVWRRIGPGLRLLDQTKVVRRDSTWHVRLCRPAG